MTDRELILEGGIVDMLYAMIRDPDPIVIVNVLCILEETLAGEGGVVINHSIAQYIFERLHVTNLSITVIDNFYVYIEFS